MPTKLLLTLTLALATACLDQPPPSAPATSGDPETLAEIQAPSSVRDEAEDTECNHIVAEPGTPCAAACDPEAMRAFIPAGACVEFGCKLDDGGLVLAGGCNR